MKRTISLLWSLGCISANSLWSYTIIGGQDSGLTKPYVALVDILTGATKPITGDLPLDAGTIGNGLFQDNVSINAYGVSLVGEKNMSDPTLWYAAIVDASGNAKLLSGSAIPSGGGDILSVSINNFNSGIVGGSQVNSPFWYAALVDPTGNTRALTGSALPTNSGGSTIQAVAINNSGNGIFGGDDPGSPGGGWFAALFNSTGATTALSGDLPVVLGGGVSTIRTVAINDSGFGIIGGFQDIGGGTKDAYLALIAPDGVATAVTGDVPTATRSAIRTVAINASGQAIAGGTQSPMNNFPYMAVISSAGVATTPASGTLPVGQGIINSVAINDSGTGIVGGQDNNHLTPYLALILPDGAGGYVANPISGAVPVGNGTILGVDIDNSGAAIAGGQDNGNTAAYAVVIAPNGFATAISGAAIPTGNGFIGSVSASLFELLVPSSFGPGSSFATPIFALSSQILPNHQRLRYRELTLSAANMPLSAANEEIALFGKRKEQILQPVEQVPCIETSTFTLWGGLFGDIAHQEQVKHIPTMNNWIGGGILGLDYQATEELIIGGDVAYAFDYVHYSKKLGHANIQEELLSLYGSWNQKNLSINAALWGGPYQLHNERHSLPNITATAHVHGWLFTPHLEICTPFTLRCNDWFILDPFAMFDWANNWQGDVKEHGRSGFNLRIDDHYTSVLRSEVGLRFFEVLSYCWGRVVLQEKASYVNKVPFHASTVPAFFIGSISAITVDMFCPQTQNLGVVQFNIEFLPRDNSYPYGCINYQGEFGSSFQNNLVSIELCMDF